MIPKITAQLITTGLANLARLQELIPYIIVRGLNRTALRVQDHTVTQLLPSKFILRTKWWMPRTRYGFNIQWANTQNIPVQATVGTQAPWVKPHEEGGEKKPTRHKFLSLPLVGIRPNIRDILERRKRPPALFKKKAYFVLNTKRGPVLYRREGGRLIALYAFEESVKIRHLLEFVKTERATVSRVYDEEYQKAFMYFITRQKPDSRPT